MRKYGKTVISLAFILCVLFIFSSCKNSESVIKDFDIEDSSVESFSYNPVFSEDSAGVRLSGFENNGELELRSEKDAVEAAKKEISVSYDSVACAYDKEAGIWRVEFWTKDVVGDCETVYIDILGKTRAIVAGE